MTVAISEILLFMIFDIYNPLKKASIALSKLAPKSINYLGNTLF